MTITSVKRIHQSDWTSSGVRFLRARDIVSAAKNEEPTDYLYISEEKYKEYSLISGKVTIGDLLVTGVGSIGVPFLITNDNPVYFKDGNVIWFKNNNVIDGKFFYYSFIHRKIQKFINDVAGIGTVGTYTIDSGKKTPISLPIKKEQEKIGNLFKQLDDTLALHQRKLTLLKQLKQTYLQALFPQSELNIPTLRFARFSDSWEHRKVSSLAKETFGGGTPKTGVKKYWKGSFPWIQSSDLTTNQLHNVQPTKFITEEAIKQSATHNVPGNSIAIVTRVGVGKLALMRSSYSTSQDFLSLSNLNVDAVFGVYCLYKMLQREVNNIQGTSIKGITKADLLGKCVSVPTKVEEQVKIGAFFKKIDDTIDFHESKLKHILELKKAFLEKMFL